MAIKPFSRLLSRLETGRLAVWAIPFLPAVILFIVSFAVVLSYGPFVLDIGDDNGIDLTYLRTAEGGFFSQEKQQGPAPSPGYDQSYRWTGREANINLPWPLTAVPLKATLHAAAPRPDRTPDQSGTVVSISKVIDNDSTALGKFNIPGFYEGSDLAFRIPGQPFPNLNGTIIRFNSSETFQPGKGDSRKLSAIFFNLKLEPDYSSFSLKNWLALSIQPFILALITLATWFTASGFFTTRKGQLAVEVISATVLVASLLFWPEAAEPYYASWLLILSAAGFALCAAKNFASAVKSIPAPFVYTATFFPVLPIVQFAFGRLQTSTLNTGTVTLSLNLAALLLSFVFYFGYRQKFETVFTAAFLFAAAGTFAFTHWQIYEYNLLRGADFRNYYLRMLVLEDNHSPLYSLQEMADYPGSAVRMPPAFSMFFWPFVRIFGHDVNAAILGWRLANEVLIIPILLLLLKIFKGAVSGVKLWPAILFMVLNFGQLGETIAYGQMNYLLLLGLCLTALFVKQQRYFLSGLTLSFPAWVKLLPGVPGLFFPLERRWRGVVGLILGTLIVNFLTVLTVGWDNVWFYFTKALFSVNEPELGIANQSWWGFMGRLAVTDIKSNLVGTGYPKYLAPAGYIATLVGLVLTIFVILRSNREDWLSTQLKLGVLMLLALWISPFSWQHYIVQALVVIVTLFCGLCRPGINHWKISTFAVSYALLGYGGLNEILANETVGLARLGSSYRFFATFALWALILWFLYHPVSRSEEIPVKAEAVKTESGIVKLRGIFGTAHLRN